MIYFAGLSLNRYFVVETTTNKVENIFLGFSKRSFVRSVGLVYSRDVNLFSVTAA